MGRVYNHLEVGHPDNSKTVPVCGAVKKTGAICQNVAGYKTDHYGRGRCFVHGGATPNGPALPQYKHGGYADAFKGEVLELFESVGLQSEGNPLDLLPELHVQRTLLAVSIAQLMGEDPTKVTGITNKQPGRKVVGGGVEAKHGHKVSSSLASTGDFANFPENPENVDTSEGRISTEVVQGEVIEGAKDLGGGIMQVKKEDLMIVMKNVEMVAGTVEKIHGMINQDRLTMTEWKYLVNALRDVVVEFIAPDKMEVFESRLVERLGAAMSGEV